MFKKILLLTLLSALTSQAASKKEITMLVVPRDAKTIQIAQDIAEYYPVLIVSYQQTRDLPKLHAWNGEGWVDISVEDYETGVFFEHPPQHAIIIEPENTPSAELLVPDGLWCERGNRLTTTDPRTMTHLLGRHFNFQNRHWKHFAGTHGVALEDLNPELINVYWWQHPGKRSSFDAEADMGNWHPLDITPPEPIEPIIIEEEPEIVVPVEIPAIEVEVKEEVRPVVDLSADVSRRSLAKAEALAEEEKTPTIEEIIETLNEAAPEIEPTVIDPFLATEIPAAEVVLPPTE